MNVITKEGIFIMGAKNKNPIDIIGRIGELNFIRWAIEEGYQVIKQTRIIFEFFCDVDKYLRMVDVDYNSQNKARIRRDMQEIKDNKHIKKHIYNIFSLNEINFLKKISTKIMINGGLPDFLIFNDGDKMFCEVKSNNAKLRDTQKTTFSILSKKFKTKLVKVNFSKPEIELIE